MHSVDSFLCTTRREKATHRPSTCSWPTAQASSSMGKLTVSSSSAASICFSARTSQIPFVEKVVAALKVKGISSYYQLDISKTGPNWTSQWMAAAMAAKVIVCILTADYPDSESTPIHLTGTPVINRTGTFTRNHIYLSTEQEPIFSSLLPNQA